MFCLVCPPPPLLRGIIFRSSNILMLTEEGLRSATGKMHSYNSTFTDVHFTLLLAKNA